MYCFRWNRKSLGIAFLAVPAGETATEPAFQAMERFLLYLVELGKLEPDYTVYGLRQVRPMFEAPCLPIYTRMKTWPHWVSLHEINLGLISRLFTRFSRSTLITKLLLSRNFRVVFHPKNLHRVIFSRICK